MGSYRRPSPYGGCRNGDASMDTLIYALETDTFVEPDVCEAEPVELFEPALQAA